jgi:hypothetical protein
VLVIEASIERYGGDAQANMPPVHNTVRIGISTRSRLNELILTLDDMRNDRMYRVSDAMNVAGYATFETAGIIVLVAEDGQSSARCFVHSDARMASQCDFFLALESASARLSVPRRIVEDSLSSIIADVRPTAAYVADQCGSS